MRANAFALVLSVILLSSAVYAEDQDAQPDPAKAARLEQKERFTSRAEGGLEPGISFVASPASSRGKADVPYLMNFTGSLTDEGGIALDTTIAMVFSIYSESWAVTPVWTETHPSVEVASGVFDVLLGSITPISDDVFSDPERWFGLQVGTDPEMDPRQRLGTVAYAFRAAEADTAEFARNVVGGEDGDWTIVGSDMYAAVPGFVGIGASSPIYKLDIRGSGPDDGVVFGIGNSDLTHRLTIYGGRQNDPNPYIHWKDGDPLRFTTDQGGWSEKMRITSDGKLGLGTQSPSELLHIYGTSNPRMLVEAPADATPELNLKRGTERYSLFMNSDNDLAFFKDGTKVTFTDDGEVGIGTSSPAEMLHLYESSGNLGMRISSDASSYQYFNFGATNGYAIGRDPSDKFFINREQPLGTGTLRVLTIQSNGNVGIGTSSTSEKLEVAGTIYGHSADTTGIYGETSRTRACGVWGENTNSGNTGKLGGPYWGVKGITDHDWAVYGSALYTDAYAGYFDGNVHITGILTGGGWKTLIDHPLDPENKLLRNNFVESPENLLIYRGKVRLDGRGEAVVEMPDYFQALTREDEASIHLTPVGRPFLTGAEWNSGFQSFMVYGKADREVFWEVLADRDDPVIHQLAMPVEEEKGPDKLCDHGELLYPTAYGYPESMGKDYKKREAMRKLEQETN